MELICIQNRDRNAAGNAILNPALPCRAVTAALPTGAAQMNKRAVPKCKDYNFQRKNIFSWKQTRFTDVMHSHSVLLALACLCWWDRWIREARAGTITLQNKPSCCRAWQGGFGGQQRKGGIGNSSGVAVSQLGKDGRWKELWLLSLASSRPPCPDFCLISSVPHFKTFLLQFHTRRKHRKAKEYPRAYNSHLTLSTSCVTCKSRSQGGKPIWGAVGNEHALHSTTYLIPHCPTASRDKQQLMRLSGCSDGPIFIPMQEQQPDSLTKCSVEQ